MEPEFPKHTYFHHNLQHLINTMIFFLQGEIGPYIITRGQISVQMFNCLSLHVINVLCITEIILCSQGNIVKNTLFV